MFLTPTLTIDLSTIVANWQLLRSRFTGKETAAVVKADAYGLGMVPVATALAEAGCDTFFVATLEEAITLRSALADRRILVLHGVQQGEEFAFRQHRLIPILNSPAQIARWKPVAMEYAHAVSALHIDTGMARMGLELGECETLFHADPNLLRDCRVGLVMSHLACASEPEHPNNGEQLNWFMHIRKLMPEMPASLCNSGGVFLDAHYHFDLARPGCSLYGIAPRHGDNPLQQVATWDAPILMTRILERDEAIGYGATQTFAKGTRIATVASGYADGYLRQLTHRAVGYIGDHKVPLIGRVTMDMLCFDVTEIPVSLIGEGMPITLLGNRDGIRVDDLAAAAGTIGYEVLTRIGARVARRYI